MKRRQLDVHGYNEMVDRFHGETDRAAALLGAAYLDTLLLEIFEAVLVPGKPTSQLLSRDLRSFSTKISFAFAFGLADASLVRDLDLLRQVRNHFAHYLWESSFAMSPVRDWCAELGIVKNAITSKALQPEVADDPRQQYLFGVALSAFMLATSPKTPDEIYSRLTGLKTRGRREPERR